MSLILEALRKSDAERRLGSAPELLAPMPILRSPLPSRRWLPVVAAALLLVAILVVVVWWSMRTTAPSIAVPSIAQSPLHGRDFATAQDAAPDKKQDASRASADSQQTRIPPPMTLPTTIDPRRIHANGSDQPPASVPSPVAEGEETRMVPMPSAGPAHRPAHDAADAADARPADSMPLPRLPASQTPRAAGTAHAVPATGPGPAPFLNTADTSTAAVPTPAPAASTPATSNSLRPVDEPTLPGLADLSATERSYLPALKVTMHVYADEPAQRFMIIDGQRISEGARLADGVILVRIRHDGAEIDAHGRRLLLPKP